MRQDDGYCMGEIERAQAGQREREESRAARGLLARESALLVAEDEGEFLPLLGCHLQCWAKAYVDVLDQSIASTSGCESMNVVAVAESFIQIVQDPGLIE